MTPEQQALLEDIAQKKTPFGYFCDWGNDSYGLQRIAMYYGEPGSATIDDWNEYPKVCENEPLYPESTVTALLDALAEARKDTERLGWLENNPHHNPQKHKKHWSCKRSINYEYSVFSSLREAIDHAMKGGE